MIPIFLTQGFNIFVTIITLLIVRGVCMRLNTEVKVYSSHEHTPIYVEEIDYTIARIHFWVLAVPIIMFGIFAVVNVKEQYPRETILWYSKVVLTATIIAIFIGILVQTICIIRDNADRRPRP